MTNLKEMPVTGKAMAPPGSTRSPYGSIALPHPNHNFGYVGTEENMYWNILVHIGFSAGGVDSAVREYWYDNVWLKWDYQSNNRGPSSIQGV